MSKYEPLRDHLAKSDAVRIVMTFRQIEQIIGSPLPKSARVYAAWWANETAPQTHLQKQAWMAAGYTIDSVDRGHGRVTFVRAR